MTQEQLLQAILDELKSSKKQVGFGWPPKPRRIFANRQYTDCLWYFWNGAKNEHEPIEHTALTGTIVKVEKEDKEYRGKPDPKLNIHIQADRPYIIQAGLDTLFAKGAIVALSQVSSFSNVTICVEPGDTDQVLFCRVYEGDQSVFSKYDDDTDFQAALAKIQRSLGQSQTSTSTEETYEYTFDESDLIGETAEATPKPKPKSKSIDRAALMATAKSTIGQLKWEKPAIAEFIASLFPGKSKTADLSDQQMVDFVNALSRTASGSTVAIEDTIAEPLQPKYSAAIKAATTVEELEKIIRDIDRDRETLSSPIAGELKRKAEAAILAIRKAEQDQPMLEEIPF